jgi:hypothetical protein
MPLRSGTSEVKGQRHFNRSCATGSSFNSALNSSPPSNNIQQIQSQRTFLNRIQKTGIALRKEHAKRKFENELVKSRKGLA